MPDKPCECSIKMYDGHYRCMLCYKEYVVATEEAVMNMTQVAPALARIHALETENIRLNGLVEAMKATMHAMRNPGYDRRLPNGGTKNTETGEVTPPQDYRTFDEFPTGGN